MNCPFCYNELETLGIQDSQYGISVEFQCNDDECEGEDKTFFISLDDSDIQY